MVIIEHQIKDIKIIDAGRYDMPNGRDPIWEIIPTYGYRLSESPIIITEVIGIDARCCINNIDARIAVVTEIEFRIGKGALDIVGENNYKLFVTLTQIAMAHTRVYFKQRFSIYDHGWEIMPLISDEILFERVKATEQQNLN